MQRVKYLKAGSILAMSVITFAASPLASAQEDPEGRVNLSKKILQNDEKGRKDGDFSSQKATERTLSTTAKNGLLASAAPASDVQKEISKRTGSGSAEVEGSSKMPSKKINKLPRQGGTGGLTTQLGRTYIDGRPKKEIQDNLPNKNVVSNEHQGVFIQFDSNNPQGDLGQLPRSSSGVQPCNDIVYEPKP